MTNSRKIHWGVVGHRMGWWLDDDIPIFGPSICVSSGGGAVDAIKEVKELGFAGHFIVIPVKHDDVAGNPCECSNIEAHYVV